MCALYNVARSFAFPLKLCCHFSAIAKSNQSFAEAAEMAAKSFHILQKRGTFDNDDARIFDLARWNVQLFWEDMGD